MRNTIIALLISATLYPTACDAQSPTKQDEAVNKMISKNFRLPDSLKTHCEWMYAIVKLETNSSNTVIGTHVVNPAYDGIKKAFKFMQGYQLPKTIKANGRPVVFYLAIDNLNGCNEKPGEKIFYAPNDAGETIWRYVSVILRNDPKAILLPGVIVYSYGKPLP